MSLGNERPEEPKVVTSKVSINKVFLKFSQKSKKYICAEVSFLIKIQIEGL